MKLLTSEMLDSIPDLIEAGMNGAEIAVKFGCALSTLAKECSFRGISLRQKANPVRQAVRLAAVGTSRRKGYASRIISDEMYDSIPGLVISGMSRVEIAARFGVTPSTLQVLCSKRGISLRRGGRYNRVSNLALTAPVEILDLDRNVLRQLRETSRVMGRSTVDLVSTLLRRIVYDDLYKAVLDEDCDKMTEVKAA